MVTSDAWMDEPTRASIEQLRAYLHCWGHPGVRTNEVLAHAVLMAANSVTADGAIDWIAEREKAGLNIMGRSKR